MRRDLISKVMREMGRKGEELREDVRQREFLKTYETRGETLQLDEGTSSISPIFFRFSFLRSVR